jgi:hypothetical protein
MFRSMLPAVLGRRVVAAGLAAVSFSLAACSDAATAPTTAPAREIGGADNIVVGGGIPDVAAFISVKIVDVNSVLLTEKATIHLVSWPNYADVQDNSATDLDPTLGVIKVKIKKGSYYEICMTGGTLNYTAEANNPTYPSCRYVETSAINVDMGKIFARKNPRVTWTMKDQFGNLLPGAVLKVTIGSWVGLVGDGDGIFDGASDGIIAMKIVSGEVPVSWCEVTPPPSKYAAITNKCGTVNVKYEKAYAFTIVHEKLIF